MRDFVYGATLMNLGHVLVAWLRSLLARRRMRQAERAIVRARLWEFFAVLGDIVEAGALAERESAFVHRGIAWANLRPKRDTAVRA